MMFINSMVQPEIDTIDLLGPVWARVRVESVVITDDGRAQVVLDLDDELFNGVHLPHLGVIL